MRTNLPLAQMTFERELCLHAGGMLHFRETIKNESATDRPLGWTQRVGGSRSIQANVRVIAATNRMLSDEVAQGRFRADLYYRLNSFHIFLPSLRERRSDIPLLCEYFLERYAAQNHTRPSMMDSDALAILKEYAYPGNVRELEQLINKLSVQAAGRPTTR